MLGKLKKYNLLISLVIITLILNTGVSFGGTGVTDSPYTVREAIVNQYSGEASVIGYVVGEPVSRYSVRTSGFYNDYAIALSDTSNDSDVSNMIFVQISKSYRATFGLSSNSSLLGKKVVVTGDLTSYFSRSGVKNISSIKLMSSIPNPDPNPDPNPNPNPDPNIGNYYAKAKGLSGAKLKSALNDIIDGHTELSYSQAWDALRRTDQDPNNSNNVIEIYTGRSIGKYENGANGDAWNREHVWAKSHGSFGTRKGAGTDLHHLRPADASVNSSRSNLDFDNGGKYHHEATLCRYDSDSFEPRDAVKGDVARMLFYMAVRYEGENGEPDLELNNRVENGRTPFHGKISTLLIWHKQDPVSNWERNRNNIIHKEYQGNRNPFIDHPEWVAEIWN